ncbi:GNAT family N-acetyltransferase [Roseibium sediminicola]|uniref:GNAT family N-acetyltransferase n=1 Tax=Roseibium sediminicola TaxID=2933272 RepID=A0ABT0GN00_9HYPH|nr:GNAT family N-acetyltransferase [Roseibium sp. CAU 1639]MCK7610789.1 GNAT family N-acetyltransferase [Roseibium sp. CAU 1639]
MPGFRIRVAAPHDEQAVSALLLKSYTALLRPAYDPATLEKALPLITKANPDLLASGSYYVACGEDGSIAGAGGWTKHSPTGRNETARNGNIRHFGTDPDAARRGIGRALMTRCLEEAAAAGLEELNCYSTLNGEAFYAACGFRTVEPFDVKLPGDVIFPSVRMVRPL